MNILVDLDGTILDCRRRLFEVFRTLEPSTELSLEEYWEHKREPRSHEWILRELHGWSADDVGRFDREWLARVELDENLRLDTPLAGAAEALELLTGLGSVYLLTSRQMPDGVRRQLESHSLSGFFSGVIVTGLGRAKAQAIRQSGLTIGPSDLVVGDTEADLETAREIGATAVSICSGFRCRRFLEECKPDFIYESLLDFATTHFGQTDV